MDEVTHTENVVVTGGGDSVARDIAEKFHALGNNVHICDVREDMLSSTLAANPGMRGTVADVGEADDVNNLFEEVNSWMDPVSVLINVVGIPGSAAPVEDISDEEWCKVMDVNINGMFYSIKNVVPGMKQAGRGVIINFSSGSTKTRLPLRTSYIVSKYAVEGMTLNLARELGPFNIRCNAILPGMINNERMAGIVKREAEKSGKTVEEIEAGYLQYISMRTKIETEEIVDMVMFLASEKARHVTGQLIGVCGNIEWEG